MAVITELAPPQYMGLMLGIWFVSLGFGAKMAGLIAIVAAVSVDTTDIGAILGMYSHALIVYGALALTVFLIMLSLVPYIKRLMLAHHAKR